MKLFFLTSIFTIAPLITFAQIFGACNCSTTVGNSVTTNFSNLVWTGTGCPTSLSTSHTGNLCIDIGNSSNIVFDKNFTVNGDINIENSGTNSKISIPQGVTVSVFGDFGDETNNNVIFAIDGTLKVSGGIYGNNGNAFDASGTGTGTIIANSVNFQNNTTCVSPANCTGNIWNVTTCNPSSSTFCNTIRPLPVSLIDFSLHADAAGIKARWSTATESNSASFILERSMDGKIFDDVGRVPAAGTTHLRQDYALTDPNPLIGRTYYRLKQIDLNGKEEYFDIKFIDVFGRKRAMIYPTLLENNEIRIQLNFSTEDVSYARILSVAGKEVGSFNFTGSEFRAPVGLGAGAYLLKVNIGNEQFLERFIVR